MNRAQRKRKEGAGDTTITVDRQTRQALDRLRPKGFTVKGFVAQLVERELCATNRDNANPKL